MLFLAVAVLVAAPSPALGQEAPSPEEVVLAFHEALASGDSATALKLLAEDVVIYESGGVEASREEYRSHHLPADMAFTSSTEREVTVEIHSTGTETMLLDLTSDGWRIRHIHWSSRRAPVPEEG
jgi:hypothetical protein